MAAKKKTKAKTAATAPRALDRILDGALAESAAVGWRRVAMEAVARRAGLSLGEVLTHVPTKGHIFARLADRLDAAMVADASFPDPQSTPRDRLFDVMMRRFDALQKHREGYASLIRDAARDPGLVAMTLARLSRSMTVALAAAGIAAEGLIGCARIHGLKAVYLSALRAWVKDDSDDMAKTMAALDKALNIAERAASMTVIRRPRGEKHAA